MKKNWHLIAFAFAGAFVLFGTISTANVTHTARHGIQLPNHVLVKAWNQDDATLVRNMREYLKSIAK